MKVGDLVSFQTPRLFESAEKNYKSPGIIIESDNSHSLGSYLVLWADGKITKEHGAYLNRGVACEG